MKLLTLVNFYFQSMFTTDHPSQDGKAVAVIEKIMMADTDHLLDSQFKPELLDGLNGTDIEFIDPLTNDGEYGIVEVYLITPKGSVVLDQVGVKQPPFFIE